MNDAFPNAHMIHLPVHASWLNQVEIYFSAVQRKALTPDDFGDLDELAHRLLTFQDHYNTTAQPFDWTFTRDDLNQLLTRISRHNRHAPQPAQQQPPTNQRARPLVRRSCDHVPRYEDIDRGADRRDHAVSFAKIRSVGFTTSLGLQQGIAGVSAAVQLLDGLGAEATTDRR